MAEPQIEFVDEKEREFFARAQLGIKVRDFLQSDVGRYLHGRAKAEVEQAQVEALECSTWTWFGRRKLRKLQHKAAVARSFMRWAVEAIQDGEIAYTELKDYRTEET